MSGQEPQRFGRLPGWLSVPPNRKHSLVKGRGARIILPPADELERQLVDAKITGYRREMLFISGRKFRADFAWADLERRLIVEVDGSTFARQDAKRCPLCGEIPKGRHSTGTGRENDCEKQNLAILNGYRYLVVTTKQVRDGRALVWIQQALSR